MVYVSRFPYRLPSSCSINLDLLIISRKLVITYGECMHTDILQPEELEFIFLMFQEGENTQHETQPLEQEPLVKEEAA